MRAEDCQAAPRCPRLAASSRPPSGRHPGDAGRPASVAAAAGRSGAVRRKRARRPEEVSAYTGVFFLIPIVSLSEVGSARSAFAQPLRSQQGRVALETGAEWPPRGTPGMGRRDLGSVFSRPGPRPVTAMLWPRGVDACAVLPRRWRWRWTPARQGEPLVWGPGRCPPHLQEVSRARIAGVASAERSDGVGVRGRCRGPGVSPGCEESPVLGEQAVERATHRGPAWFAGGKAGLGLEGLGPNVRGRVEVGAAVGEAGRTSCPVRVGEPLPHPVRAWPGLSAGGRRQDAAAPATDPAHRASCRVLPRGPSRPRCVAAPTLAADAVSRGGVGQGRCQGSHSVSPRPLGCSTPPPHGGRDQGCPRLVRRFQSQGSPDPPPSTSASCLPPPTCLPSKY